MSKTILITGANRGIGLGIVRQAVKDSSFSSIFATARNVNDAKALHELVEETKGRVVIVPLNASEPASFTSAASLVKEKLAGKGLDVLVNNIGICQAGPQITTETLRSNFEVNVVGVQLAFDAFLPLVLQSKEKKVINVSSAMGSIEVASGHLVKAGFPIGLASYSISKAGLNMLTKMYATLHAKDGLIAIPIHPGLVDTDMNANLDPEIKKFAISVEQSASGVFAVINKLTAEDNGKFFNVDGTPLPW